mmetsp:Transcript_16392/g.49130  ORF Transcript_16392/g.49130 Transcript_16392/m.49130 type:complete len:660 (-) Transcript_16392:1075-3054(-)
MLTMLPTQGRSCTCLSSRVASCSTALRPVFVCRAAPAPQPRLRQQRPQWLARQGEQRNAILCAAAAAETETAELDADEDADTYADLSEAERSQLDLEAADFAAAEIAVSLKNVYEGMVSDDFLQELEEEEAAPAVDEVTKKKGTKVDKPSRRSSRGSAPPEREIPIDRLPKVAVVGRPNVGKSALFNRITGTGMAIVYDYAGVTRDRLYIRASWGDREFVMIDTGGLMSEAAKLPEAQQSKAMREISSVELPTAIERQAAAGIEEAKVLILVVDGQTGITGADEEVVSWLRKTHPKKPVILAVNKCENVGKADEQAADFWALGHSPIAISAISGTGTGDLMDALVNALPPPPKAEEEDVDKSEIAVAIVGRPNVGKSSLVNAITGKERSIVSNMRGTTRDAIDTDVKLPDGRKFKLIDTAGIRKRVAIKSSPDGAEGLSVDRAFRAIRRCDVVALVIDAVDGITQQDFRLSELVLAEGRACVIIVNKWDLIPNKETNTLKNYQEDLLSQLRPINWAQVVFTSAVTGQRLPKILDAVQAAGEQHRRRVTTATLNMVVREAVGWRSPPSARGDPRKGRVYYGTQAATRPPTYVFFVNDAKLFNDDYRLYMERSLRESIGLSGTPLRVYFRSRRPGLTSEKTRGEAIVAGRRPSRAPHAGRG